MAMPNLKLKGNVLVCGKYQVNLRARPLLKRMIKTFLEHPESTVSKKDLVEKVYVDFKPSTRTLRFQKVLEKNLTKLISRSRQELEMTFNENQHEPWIEFLRYHHRIQSWSLCWVSVRFLENKVKRKLNLHLVEVPNPYLDEPQDEGEVLM